MSKEKVKNKFTKNLNPTRIVVLGFCGIILVGTFFLWLPISARSGQFTNPLTCLFTATSATCVTGLAKVDTWLYWSPFGQVIVLLMIQMGGLGFVSVISMVSFFFHQRIGLSQRLVMASALNMNGTSGVVRVVRRSIMGTFLFEFLGACVLATRFIPEYGVNKGLWFSVFHSVSAFCNGGFDLMGGVTGEFSSFTGYYDDPLILITLMVLITAGGLGFFVWEDIMQRKGDLKNLTLYSKMVIMATWWLGIIGSMTFMALEWHNEATLGTMRGWEKVLNAVFQTVTLRTAGFATIDQSGLTDGSALVSIVYMLIGGSSGSTAGGLKTVTAGVLFIALRDNLKGKEDVVFRGRTIPHRQVLNATVLLQMVLTMFFFGTLALTITDSRAFLPSAYEAASAMGTVGLSMNLSPDLNALSSLVIILLMFLGRVGILSISIAFMTKKRQANIVKYPTVDMMIG